MGLLILIYAVFFAPQVVSREPEPLHWEEPGSEQREMQPIFSADDLRGPQEVDYAARGVEGWSAECGSANEADSNGSASEGTDDEISRNATPSCGHDDATLFRDPSLDSPSSDNETFSFTNRMDFDSYLASDETQRWHSERLHSWDVIARDIGEPEGFVFATEAEMTEMLQIQPDEWDMDIYEYPVGPAALEDMFGGGLLRYGARVLWDWQHPNALFRGPYSALSTTEGSESSSRNDGGESEASDDEGESAARWERSGFEADSDGSEHEANNIESRNEANNIGSGNEANTDGSRVGANSDRITVEANSDESGMESNSTGSGFEANIDGSRIEANSTRGRIELSGEGEGSVREDPANAEGDAADCNDSALANSFHHAPQAEAVADVVRHVGASECASRSVFAWQEGTARKPSVEASKPFQSQLLHTSGISRFEARGSSCEAKTAPLAPRGSLDPLNSDLETCIARCCHFSFRFEHRFSTLVKHETKTSAEEFRFSVSLQLRLEFFFHD